MFGIQPLAVGLNDGRLRPLRLLRLNLRLLGLRNALGNIAERGHIFGTSRLNEWPLPWLQRLKVLHLRLALRVGIWMHVGLLLRHGLLWTSIVANWHQMGNGHASFQQKPFGGQIHADNDVGVPVLMAGGQNV